MPDRDGARATPRASRAGGRRYLLHGAADARGVQRPLTRDGGRLGQRPAVLGAAARTNVADPGDIADTLMPAITEGRVRRSAPGSSATQPRLRVRSSAGTSTPAAVRWPARPRGEWGSERASSGRSRRRSSGGTARVRPTGFKERRSPFRAGLPVPPPMPRGSMTWAAPRRLWTRCGGARVASSTPRSSRCSPRRGRAAHRDPRRGSARAAARGRARAGQRDRPAELTAWRSPSATWPT